MGVVVFGFGLLFAGSLVGWAMEKLGVIATPDQGVCHTPLQR